MPTTAVTVAWQTGGACDVQAFLDGDDLVVAGSERMRRSQVGG